MKLNPEMKEINVLSHTRNLAKVRRFVSQFLVERGLCQRHVDEIKLAVDEAVTNIIEHAYRGQDQGQIKLSSECQEGEWIITIQDTGRPFDPRAVPKPNLNIKVDDIKTGGLGLYFMHQLMDNVEFTFDKKGNRLRMVKREV